MYAESPFLVRRVIGGVLVVAALVAVAALVWVHLSISRYHDRENRVVAHYRSIFQTCEDTQGSYGNCAARIGQMCTEDSFWDSPQPYSFGLGADLPDATVSCAFGSAASS